MAKLTFPVTPLIRQELDKANVRHFWNNIDVHEDSYQHLRELIENGGYGHLSEDERHAIAVGCCYTHPDHKDKHLEPLRHPIKKASSRYAEMLSGSTEWKVYSQVFFRVAVIVMLVLLLTSPAHCQGTSQIDVITFRNAAGTTVKSFAAPFTIKEGSNVTFSAIGSTLTITGAAGGGGGYATIQNAGVAITQRAIINWIGGALICADNAGNVSSDCKLATNNAVANQYLTGVDSTGAFTRKQIAYGELSGAPTLPATLASASHKWLNSYSSVTGLFTQTQPDYSDLTGTPAVPTGTGFSHITSGALDSASKLVNLTASTDVAANQGTTTTVFHGNAAGQGSFGSVVSADHNITPTTCTNQFVSAISSTVAGTCSTITSASTSGTFPASAIGTDKQVAFNKAAVESGSADLTWDDTAKVFNIGQATALTNNPLAISGNVNDFLQINIQNKSAGNAASSDYVATSDQGSNTVGYVNLGINSSTYNQAGFNITGVNDGYLYTQGGAAAGGGNMVIGTGSAGQVVKFHTGGTTSSNLRMTIADTAITGAVGVTATWDTLQTKYWGNAPIFNPSKYAGTDMCDKIAAVFADSAYTSVKTSIIDARGFTGDQNCATSNPFNVSHSTKWLFNPGLHVHLTIPVYTLAPATSSLIAAPSAPTLSTSTSGGSLAAATTYGVKVTLQNFSGETTPSAEATKLTGAGATNSITVTSPAVSQPTTFGAVCYNVYSTATPGSGWKLNNTTGCIGLGTSYVIKTVGAGAIPPATNLAANDQYEVDFGGSTWSLESGTAELLVAANNTYFHDVNVVNSTTSSPGQSIQTNSNISNVWYDKITITGGGIGIAVNDGDFNIRITNIKYGNPTIGGSAGQAGVYITSGGGTAPKNVIVDGFELLPSVFNTTTLISAGVETNPCNDCTIQRVRCTNTDMSQSSFGGCVEIAGNNSSTTGSTNINVNNVLCDGLIWMDCVAVTGFSSGVNIDNVVAKNSNAVVGITGLNTFQQGDCIDIYTASKVNVTNVLCQSMNTLNHTLPSIEIYENSEISLSNVQSLDSGSGAVIFGSPNTHLTNFIVNRSWNSGLDFKDETAVVTCNGTTALVRVSGNPFGPWNSGTAVTIAGTPFNVASVTDINNLTLMTPCSLGASQAFIVPTADVTIVAPKLDDNGQNGTGTGARTGTAEGIVVRDHSAVTILGGSANDNQPVAANKHQQYGVRVTGTTARARIVKMDTTNNAGGTACGLEYGANVAGNHGICDDAKLSTVDIDDNFGEISYSSNRKVMNANSSALSSTQTTIMSWSIGASFNQSFSCVIYYQAAATTGALRLDLTVPASGTYVQYSALIYSDNGTAKTAASGTAVASATNISGIAAATANTTYRAQFDGTIANGTTAGTVAVQAGTAASTVTIQKGSFCNISGS